tara:strand:+ start:656 stop:961 length:306 start_codon:yes stop_codon:yes gene_type:complete
MRFIIYGSSILSVMALAYWANSESYKTKEAINSTKNLQGEIGELKEKLNVLNAEWAYLNRPDRLADLVKWNYKKLGLIPISADNFQSLQTRITVSEKDRTH